MSDTLIVLLAVYIIVALGAALGTVPRQIFKHPIERFVVRVSCGLLWPMFAGYVLMHAARELVGLDGEDEQR